jgi:hypothetical protein
VKLARQALSLPHDSQLLGLSVQPSVLHYHPDLIRDRSQESDIPIVEYPAWLSYDAENSQALSP